jgi:hypothetical protein
MDAIFQSLMIDACLFGQFINVIHPRKAMIHCLKTQAVGGSQPEPGIGK